MELVNQNLIRDRFNLLVPSSCVDCSGMQDHLTEPRSGLCARTGCATSESQATSEDAFANSEQARSAGDGGAQHSPTAQP